MIRALITGSLYGDPTARTSQAGKQFVTAKIRADGKDGASVWCSIIAFGDIADRLMTLGNGAALAVSGKAEVNGWLDKSGEPKAGFSLVVDEVATLKGKPRPPQGERSDAPSRQGEAHRSQRAKRQPVGAGAGFDDDLPDFM
jgi:single-stranded DNA-binding protein